MREIINLFFDFINHIYDNLSNYILAIGIIFVCFYIYITFGVINTILAVGILLIFLSIIIELNRSNRSKPRK